MAVYICFKANTNANVSAHKQFRYLNLELENIGIKYKCQTPPLPPSRHICPENKRYENNKYTLTTFTKKSEFNNNTNVRTATRESNFEMNNLQQSRELMSN